MYTTLKTRHFPFKFTTFLLREVASLLPVRNDIEITALLSLGKSRLATFELTADLEEIV